MPAGEMQSGKAISLPKQDVDVETAETGRSTRGRRRYFWKARLLEWRVIWSVEPEL